MPVSVAVSVTQLVAQSVAASAAVSATQLVAVSVAVSVAQSVTPLVLLVLGSEKGLSIEDKFSIRS